jgi:fibronectin-binding autotransporter adhesin
VFSLRLAAVPNKYQGLRRFVHFVGGGKMKIKTRAALLRAAMAVIPVTVMASMTEAGTNGTYTKIASGGTWEATADWSGGIVADGQDGIADFSTLNLTAANTVTLGLSRSIGTLKFSDTTATFYGWTISGGTTLNLNTSTGVPIINITNDTATLGTILSGTQGLNETGNGTLTISGTANTFTSASVFNISGGTLQILADGSLGAAPTTPTPGQIMLGGGAIFNENAAGVQVINANRGIELGTGGATINVFSGKTMSYAGIIADIPGQTGSLITNSTGTLLLSGISTYSGNTSITAGTIQLGINNALPTGTTLVFNGTQYSGDTLDLNGHSQTVAGITDTSNQGRFITNSNASAASTFTVAGGGAFNGIIQNGGAGKVMNLTKSVGGTLTLGSTNTYTGITTISGGTLALSGNGSILNSSNISVGSGAVFDVSAATAYAVGSSQVITGGGNINGNFSLAAGTINPGTVGTAGTLTFNNNLTLSGGILSLDLSSAGNTTGGGVNDLISVGGALNLNSPTQLAVSFSGTPAVGTVYTILNAASETGSGNFVATKHGYSVNNSTPGVVQVTYLGGPSVANLQWNSTSSSTWDVNTTQNFFNTDTSMNDYFFNGDNVTFNDATPGVQTSVNLSTPLAPGSLTVNSSSNNYTFSGSGKITGATGLTKSGSSLLTMSTVLNDYSGVTNISGGTLNVAGLANINTASSIGSGSVAGSAADLVLNGGTLQYTGSTAQTTNRLLTLGTSGGTIDSSSNTAAAILTFNSTGPIAFSGSGARILTLTGSNTGTSVFAPVIGDGSGGSTSVSKTGSGAWSLTGTNTFTGPVSVTGGTLIFTGDANLGAVPSVPTSGSIVLNGGLLNQAVSGSVTINSNRGIAIGNSGGTFQLFSGKILNYGGVIADAPGASGGVVSKDSVGTLILSGSSTYSGITNLIAGTIQLGASNALPAATTVSFNNPTYQTVFDLNGHNQTVAGLSDTALGSPTTHYVTNSNTGTGTLTVTGTSTYNGPLQDGGAGKLLALTKSTAGMLTLGGVNTYTGPTNITGGTLALNGGSIVSPSINVAAGATFDVTSASNSTLLSSQTLTGNGSVNGNLALNGTINPGTVGTAGTLTFNNDLSLNGGTIQLDLSGASNTSGGSVNDLLTVAGNLNINNVTPISVTFTGTPAIGTEYLVLTAGTENGSTSNLIPAQHGYTIDNSVPGQIGIIVTGSSGAATLVWNSTSSGNWDIATSANWFNTGTSANDEFFNGDNVTFNDSTPGVQTNINLTTSLAPGSVTVNSNISNYSFSGSGKITGTTGLTKSGTSTLTMNTILNDYSGVTNISGGILNVSGLANVNVASSIGTGSVAGSAADLVLNGGTLQFTGSTSQSTNRLFSLGTAGGTIDASGTGALSFIGTGAIGFNGQAGARTLTLTGSNTVTSTLSPILGDNGGATSILKTGAGTWALSGVNTFSGPVTVTGGSLVINNSDLNLGAVPATAAPGDIVLNGGELTDNVTGTLTLNSNRGIALGSSGGTIAVNFSKAMTYGGVIANLPGIIGSLTKEGLGSVLLSNSSTYSGSTTINAGVLQLGTNNALPINTPLVFNDLVFSNPNATLDVNGFSQTVSTLTDTSTKPDNITSSGVGTGNLTVTGGGNFLGVIGDGGSGKVMSLTKSGTGTLLLSGVSTYTGTTNISSGTLALSPTGSIANSNTVNVGGTALLQASTGTGILARTFSTVSINAGGLVSVAPASVQSNRQVVVLGGGSISTSVSGAFNGRIELGNNDLVLQNGGSQGLAFLTAAAKQGMNAGGALWQGSGGITSASAAADTTHLTTLGVIQNSVDGTPTGAVLYGSGTTLGLFDGVSSSPADVLVKYTYYGDANLDGKVDGSDYSRVDAGYLSGATGWYNGDFNYDGVINGSDYTLIDNAFNTQGAVLAAQIAVATSEIAGPQATSAVPEPASFGILALATTGLLCRRRRRCSNRLTGAR